MKKNNFKILHADDQARFLARHMPRGRAWNTRSGTSLYKFIRAIASGLSVLFDLVWNTAKEFDISTATAGGFLGNWEESLGLTAAGTEEERRGRVKAQLRKTTTANKKELEAEINRFLGYEVHIEAGNDIVEDDNTFPYSFPIFFWGGNYGAQRRFLVYIFQVEESDKDALRRFVEKIVPSNVFAVIP